MRKLATVCIVSIVVLSGCASASKKLQRVEAKVIEPIDCDNAHMDIMYLEEAKADTQEKLANGVATVLPTTAILNLISGEYKSRQAIATGKLNDILYDKIMAISAEC
ncbi:MAG: hypothetical protein AAGJ37_10890 [Pseudomonadota bacterium]